jgi:nucleoid-associated protein YgaU
MWQRGRIAAQRIDMLQACLRVLLFLCFALDPQPVSGGEETGRVTLLFQYHSNSTSAPNPLLGNPLFGLAVPSLSTADLHVDSDQLIVNWGTLKTSMDLSDYNHSFRPGRGMLQLSDHYVGGWKFDFTVGDHPLSVYNFEFGLSSVFNPYANLRGGRISASTKRMSFTLFGGRVTALNGLFGESVSLTQENLFGAQAKFDVSPKLKVATNLLHTSLLASAQGNTVPRSSTVVTSDMIFDWTHNIELLGETSFSTFSGAPNTDHSHGTDFSYLLGSKFKGVRGSAEVSWARLGSYFLPLANFNVGDRAGLFSTGNYQISHEWSVYGSFNRYRNNMMDVRTQPTLNISSEFVGVRYNLTPRSTLNLRVGRYEVESSEHLPNFVSSHSHTVDMDFSKEIGTWRLVARYSESRSLDFTTLFEHNLRQRMEVEVRKNWKNGASAWVSAGNPREINREMGKSTSSLSASAGFNWNVNSQLSVFSDLNWNQNLIALRSSSFNDTSINMGLNWTLPHDVFFSINGQYNRTVNGISLLDTLTATPETLNTLQQMLLNQQFNKYQFTIRIQKTFRWGQRPQESYLPSSSPAGLSGKPLDFGNIEGVVFNDLDQDGVQADQEPGVAGVTVLLDGRVQRQVDPQGRFEFKNVPVGLHTVELDSISLPASFDAETSGKMTVRVTKRVSTSVHIPLLQLGRIVGKVVLVDEIGKNVEENAEAEKPGQNIIILLNEAKKVTFTDPDGEFEFSNIPSGEYRVRIDPGTIPEFSSIVSDEVLSVKLQPGSKVSNLKFVVQMKPRPNRRILVASQTLPQPPGGADRKYEVASREDKRIAVSRSTSSKKAEPSRTKRPKDFPVFALAGGNPTANSLMDTGGPPSFQGVLIHEVQKGDTLGALALRYYRTNQKWETIYKANKGRIGSSKQLRVGQKLKIPIGKDSAALLQPNVGMNVPVTPIAANAQTPKPARTSAFVAFRSADSEKLVVDGMVIHEVQTGETLCALALKYYKTKDKWKVIYQANRKDVPESKHLRVGQTIRIPVEKSFAKLMIPPNE